MHTQSSASLRSSSTTADPTPVVGLREHTVVGIAGVLLKVLQIAHGQPLVELNSLPDDQRHELVCAARQALRGLMPAENQRAISMAQARAEQVMHEEGFIPSDAGRNLARRIATEAILTHRLTLDGSLDRGGVR